MYTKTKKNKTPIKPPTKIGRSNENRPLKEGVKYYFTDLCLKNYGNLRKVRRFDPRQIQTVSKMVQSRPKDASKLNPTCCKDVPKVFIPNTVTNTKLIWLFLISIAVHNKDKYKDKRINIPCFHLVFTLAFFGRYPEKASQ